MNRSITQHIVLCAVVLTCAGCGTPRTTPAATAPTPAIIRTAQPIAALPSAAPTSFAPSATVPATAAPTVPAPTATMPATAVPATATPQPDPPVRLVIDAINLDQPLVSVGLDQNNVPIVPNHEIGWYNLSATLSDNDNIVLWGHVLRFRDTPKIAAPFARLHELKTGAVIQVYDGAGTARPYVVTQQVQATPDEVEYILPHGKAMLTLVSCIGDKVIVAGNVEMTHRLITIAEPAP